MGLISPFWFRASAPSGPVDPYPFFSVLDLANIHWHTGAGAWGAQDALTPPDEAVTTTSTRVFDNAGFDAARANGAEIIVDASANLTNVFLINLSDVRIIVEDGAVMADIICVNVVARLTVQGETFGVFGTGRIGAINAGNQYYSDLILDGLTMDTGYIYGGNSLHRASITRCAFLEPQANGLCESAETHDVVIAGCTALGNTTSGGWIIRVDNGWRRIVVYQCHFRNSVNATIRPGMSNVADSGGNMWIEDCTLVNSTQHNASSTGQVFRTSNSSGETEPMRGVTLINSRIHGAATADGACECQVTTGRTNYALFSGNRYITGNGTDPVDASAGVGETFIYGTPTANTRAVIGAADTALPAWNNYGHGPGLPA